MQFFKMSLIILFFIISLNGDEFFLYNVNKAIKSFGGSILDFDKPIEKKKVEIKVEENKTKKIVEINITKEPEISEEDQFEAELNSIFQEDNNDTNQTKTK